LVGVDSAGGGTRKRYVGKRVNIVGVNAVALTLPLQFSRFIVVRAIYNCGLLIYAGVVYIGKSVICQDGRGWLDAKCKRPKCKVLLKIQIKQNSTTDSKSYAAERAAGVAAVPV